MSSSFFSKASKFNPIVGGESSRAPSNSRSMVMMSAANEKFRGTRSTMPSMQLKNASLNLEFEQFKTQLKDENYEQQNKEDLKILNVADGTGVVMTILREDCLDMTTSFWKMTPAFWKNPENTTEESAKNEAMFKMNE